MSESEYYHVRITTKSGGWSDEVKLDLSKERLIKRYLKPYENGTVIINSIEGFFAILFL